MKKIIFIYILFFASFAFANVQLVIKKPNGDLYWQENFNTRAELDRWLAEEKTRTYWDTRYTTEIIDKTEEEAAKREADRIARETIEVERATLASQIKTAAAKRSRTLTEANALIDKLVEYLGL